MINFEDISILAQRKAVTSRSCGIGRRQLNEDFIDKNPYLYNLYLRKMKSFFSFLC
jgi:hypothetical protein